MGSTTLSPKANLTLLTFFSTPFGAGGATIGSTLGGGGGGAGNSAGGGGGGGSDGDGGGGGGNGDGGGGGGGAGTRLGLKG